MQCPQCGYVMSVFDKVCPRCTVYLKGPKQPIDVKVGPARLDMDDFAPNQTQALPVQQPPATKVIVVLFVKTVNRSLLRWIMSPCYPCF